MSVYLYVSMLMTLQPSINSLVLSLFLRRLSFSFTNIAASIFVQVFFPLLLLLLLIDRYVTLSSIDQDTFLMLVALLKTEAKRQGEARR